jgi:hypothetical protein
MAFGIDDIIGEGLKLANKFIKDPAEQQRFAFEMEQLKQSDRFKEIDADLQRAQMQADVNKVEAASSDPFTSRWRPCVGYVCAAGLAYAAIIEPCLRLAVTVHGVDSPLPEVDTMLTLQLLFGLLGLGAARTHEKVKGAA